MVAKLLKHMYGTRDAADGWQEEYSTSLIALGFTQGRASPCLFAHRVIEIADCTAQSTAMTSPR